MLRYEQMCSEYIHTYIHIYISQRKHIHFTTYQPSSRWNANWYEQDGSRSIECISCETIFDCACAINTNNGLFTIQKQQKAPFTFEKFSALISIQ